MSVKLTRTLNGLLLLAPLCLAGGCQGDGTVTTRMYEIRSGSDKTFVETVLQEEDKRHKTRSFTNLGDDQIINVTTSNRAHYALRKSLNVRVSDQWPHDWRTNEFR